MVSETTDITYLVRNTTQHGVLNFITYQSQRTSPCSPKQQWFLLVKTKVILSHWTNHNKKRDTLSSTVFSHFAPPLSSPTPISTILPT